MQGEPDMSTQDADIKQFPPITKQKALGIAARSFANHSRQFKCYSKMPESCRIYVTYPEQPCWYVYVPSCCSPSGGGPHILGSNRVIVISRLTGEILYDGSANDDG
jgi:hypothetical protein